MRRWGEKYWGLVQKWKAGAATEVTTKKKEAFKGRETPSSGSRDTSEFEGA